MLSRWPPFLQDVPEFVAIAHASALAIEDAEAKLEQARDQRWPNTADIMLREWEAILGAPISPAGQTLTERRSTVLAYLQRLRGTPYRLTWNQKVAMLIGSVYTLEEHDPADPASPAAHVIRVKTPYAPGSAYYAQLFQALRDITPAHLEIQLVFTGGFLLDDSPLDVGAL